MHYIIYKNEPFPKKNETRCLIPNHTVLTKPQNKNAGCYTQILHHLSLKICCEEFLLDCVL